MTPVAGTPEALVLAWARALRQNQPIGLLTGLPLPTQSAIEAGWSQHLDLIDPGTLHQIDAYLALLRLPQASAILAGQMRLLCASLDPAQLSAELQQIQGFLTTAGRKPIPGAADGTPAAEGAAQFDYATLAQLCGDLIAWLPSSGLNDPQKMRAVCTHLVAGIQGLQIASSQDLHRLTLADVLRRAGPTLVHLKAILALYGLQADALLDSVACRSDALPQPAADAGLPEVRERRLLGISWTAFDHLYTVRLPVERTLQGWRLAGGKDSIVSTASQLVMMAMLLGGAGGEGAVAPGPVTPGRAGPAPAPSSPAL